MIKDEFYVQSMHPKGLSISQYEKPASRQVYYVGYHREGKIRPECIENIHDELRNLYNDKCGFKLNIELVLQPKFEDYSFYLFIWDINVK